MQSWTWYDKGSWTIALEDVRLLLELYLPRDLAIRGSGERAEHFNFMGLPAELRILIYQMVLLLPKSGVSIRLGSWYSRTSTTARVFTRKIHQSINEVDVFGQLRREDRLLRVAPLAQHLALLSVNKEVFAEASKVFYGENTFVFDSPDDLKFVLDRMSSDRASRLERIALDFAPSDAGHAIENFRAMAEKLTGLKVLDLCIEESEWTSAKKWVKRVMVPKFPDLLKIPGLKILRSMRGLMAVRLHGTCPTIGPILQAEMTMEKAIPKVKRKYIKKAVKTDSGKGKKKA